MFERKVQIPTVWQIISYTLFLSFLPNPDFCCCCGSHIPVCLLSSSTTFQPFCQIWHLELSGNQLSTRPFKLADTGSNARKILTETLPAFYWFARVVAKANSYSSSPANHMQIKIQSALVSALCKSGPRKSSLSTNWATLNDYKGGLSFQETDSQVVNIY